LVLVVDLGDGTLYHSGECFPVFLDGVWEVDWVWLVVQIEFCANGAKRNLNYLGTNSSSSTSFAFPDPRSGTLKCFAGLFAIFVAEHGVQWRVGV
jgi:hypothetical protein